MQFDAIFQAWAIGDLALDPKRLSALQQTRKTRGIMRSSAKWMRAEHELKEILKQTPRHFSARSVLALVEFQRAPSRRRACAVIWNCWRRIQNNSASMACSADLPHAGNYDEAERYNHEAHQVAPQFVESMGSLV